MADAVIWGVAVWAMFAVAAGSGLTVAAIAFGKRSAVDEPMEFEVGYNMMAPILGVLEIPAKI